MSDTPQKEPSARLALWRGNKKFEYRSKYTNENKYLVRVSSIYVFIF